MLNSLPDDMLCLILQNVTKLQDLKALSKTCKRVHAYIRFQLEHLRLCLTEPNPISFKFLPNLASLKHLTLSRAYDVKLDLFGLRNCKGLLTLTLNNRHGCSNFPPDVRVVVDGDPTLKSTKASIRAAERLEAHERQQERLSVSPKDYFMSRYNTRFGKYGSKKFGRSL